MATDEASKDPNSMGSTTDDYPHSSCSSRIICKTGAMTLVMTAHSGEEASQGPTQAGHAIHLY
jgi:hypothetical protein